MEKVITVSLQSGRARDRELLASLDELEQLVETAGGRVVESHLQKKERPDPATFIGKGKALELEERVRSAGARTLVFDEELRPGQQRSLEELTGAKVVDRTRLILDIFAQRARTREGQMQVELAQLEYLLPRLTARFGRFEQQVGGIGTRGPGERKLEVDRRRLRDRISALKKGIDAIAHERSLQRAVRRSVPVPQVAFVGYTNAGKSTLLNKLLDLSAGAPKNRDHRVYADNRLFDTLDPTTRRIRLPTGRIILFSDTVGFIRKLPTELIAAFRATLEEVATADLLVHVIDASDPEWRAQEEAVLETLERLSIAGLPRLSAYNKMDRLSPSQIHSFKRQGGVLFSATTGKGLPELLAAVEERLAKMWVEKELVIPFSEGARLARIHEHMDVLSSETTADGVKVKVRSHPAVLAQWLKNTNHDAGQ